MHRPTLARALPILGCLGVAGCADRVMAPRIPSQYYRLHVAFSDGADSAPSGTGAKPSPVALPTGQKVGIRADCGVGSQSHCREVARALHAVLRATGYDVAAFYKPDQVAAELVVREVVRTASFPAFTMSFDQRTNRHNVRPLSLDEAAHARCRTWLHRRMKEQQTALRHYRAQLQLVPRGAATPTWERPIAFSAWSGKAPASAFFFEAEGRHATSDGRPQTFGVDERIPAPIYGSPDSLLCVNSNASVPAYVGGADVDGDGVLNEHDRCDAPEDRDGFKDEDGCPDHDDNHNSLDDRLEGAVAGALVYIGVLRTREEDAAPRPVPPPPLHSGHLAEAPPIAPILASPGKTSEQHYESFVRSRFKSTLVQNPRVLQRGIILSSFGLVAMGGGGAMLYVNQSNHGRAVLSVLGGGIGLAGVAAAMIGGINLGRAISAPIPGWSADVAFDGERTTLGLRTRF